MVQVKVEKKELKRIDGKTFEIWARFTKKSEAQSERKQVAKKFSHARVKKDAKGTYSVWVTSVKGSLTEHLRRGGTVSSRMGDDGRLRSYRQ